MSIQEVINGAEQRAIALTTLSARVREALWELDESIHAIRVDRVNNRPVTDEMVARLEAADLAVQRLSKTHRATPDQ